VCHGGDGGGTEKKRVGRPNREAKKKASKKQRKKCQANNFGGGGATIYVPSADKEDNAQFTWKSSYWKTGAGPQGGKHFKSGKRELKSPGENEKNSAERKQGSEKTRKRPTETSGGGGKKSG